MATICLSEVLETTEGHSLWNWNCVSCLRCHQTSRKTRRQSLTSLIPLSPFLSNLLPVPPISGIQQEADSKSHLPYVIQIRAKQEWDANFKGACAGGEALKILMISGIPISIHLSLDKKTPSSFWLYSSLGGSPGAQSTKSLYFYSPQTSTFPKMNSSK